MNGISFQSGGTRNNFYKLVGNDGLSLTIVHDGHLVYHLTCTTIITCHPITSPPWQLQSLAHLLPVSHSHTCCPITSPPWQLQSLTHLLPVSHPHTCHPITSTPWQLQSLAHLLMLHNAVQHFHVTHLLITSRFAQWRVHVWTNWAATLPTDQNYWAGHTHAKQSTSAMGVSYHLNP